jgi:hypothetical protein
MLVTRVWPYLRHPTRSNDKLHVIKATTEEDRESWRVIKLSESHQDNVFEDRSFEVIDVLAEVVKEPRSLSQLSTLSAVISRLSSKLGCSRVFEGGSSRPPVKVSLGVSQIEDTLS